VSEDHDFQVRIGRIGAKRSGRARTFLAAALVAAQRAGGLPARRAPRIGAFGRGRAASLSAGAGLVSRSRRVIVKARVVRPGAGRAPLGVHLNYLQREGVGRDETPGAVFDADRDQADGRAFVDRCEGDRHHFRFIVSPEDAAELSDLKAYTRELMATAERDLGTRLDWVAIDHWNTAQPHIHVLVRGRAEDGADLVISKDYIAQGLRARAAELATVELGRRSDLEVRRDLDAQVRADRWTRLDRNLQQLAAESDGLIDLRGDRANPLRALRLGRLAKLRALGLADEVRPGRWRMSADSEPTLRALGQRGDVIARMHRAMSGRDVDPARFEIDPPNGAGRTVGRLAARGLDDELAGTAYAVVESVDGRVQHVPLRDLADASDAPLGAIVEVGAVDGQNGSRRLALWVRSDLGLADQVSAEGATWLDRHLVSREATSLGSSGFGREVRDALEARTDHLVQAGLAQRRGGRVMFAPGLLQTLRERELQAAALKIAAKTGLEPRPASEPAVSGAYRQRLNLASGRFAVIEGAMGFALVPWRPELDRHLGRHVEGERLPGGRIAWSFSRTRGLGR
jgi:type IV secretory pathway VirD2 relaxase